MDIARSYRYAAFLPPVLTLAGVAAAVAAAKTSTHPVLVWIGDAGGAFAFTGLYALVPYALFMVVVWFFFRPEGDTAHRHMAVLAPLYIAASIDVLLAVLFLFGDGRGSWKEGLGYLMGVSMIVLAVGYLHAGIVIAVVEGSAAVARWRSARTNRAGFTDAAP